MMMIKLAIDNVPYRTALREMLAGHVDLEVRCVDQPDMTDSGVVVLDAGHLTRLPLPLQRPERVVLIASKEPAQLTRAWEAGVNSVVYEKDPLSTAVLAIMSARLRCGKQRHDGGG